MPSCEPSRADLVSMILGSYREMPGLCLRVEQAARLFGVSVGTCNVVLPELVRQGRLRLDACRQYHLGEDHARAS